MDIWLVLFVSAAFVSVAGITFSVGHLITSRNRLQRRLPAGARTSDALALTSPDDVGALLGEPFNEDRFGLGQRLGKELRLKLVRAGYFSPSAVRFYIFARLCAIIAAPSLVLLGGALMLRDLSTLQLVLAAAASAALGVLGPDAYLSRRQSRQIAEYRLNFPDLLDLLTVCVTAGLTVEASFERIRARLSKRSRALGHNIELMGLRCARGEARLTPWARSRTAGVGGGGVVRRSPAAFGGAGRRHRHDAQGIQRRHAVEENAAGGKKSERAAGQNGRPTGPWDFPRNLDDCSSPGYFEIAPTYRFLSLDTEQEHGDSVAERAVRIQRF